MLHPLSCRFRDPHTEQHYRETFVDADRRQATITALVLLVPMLAFFANDLGFFAHGGVPVPLVLARLGTVALTIALVARLRWPIDPRSFDRLLTGWWLALTVFILYVNSTRPHGYLLHNMVDAAVVLIALVVPLTSQPLQLVPGIVVACGNIAQAYAAREGGDNVPIVVVTLTYFMVLGVGYSCGWRLHATRREHYAALQAQVELQRRLEELANTDVLTGIPNRRAFLARSQVEIARARRHDRALSLLMIDIDHFKRINDSWGHEAGDAALLAVTRTLGEALRTPDLLARMGGEEFAVLMPETPSTRAVQVAERLCERGRTLAWNANDGGARLTLSIGVATLGAGDADLAELLRRADKALYEAKHEGRDRVIAR